MDEQRLAAAAPGTPRRQRQRLAAVQEIKDAALAELRRHGPSGVSMRAVARSIDLTPSGLYRYVPDHTSLLAALSIDALDSLREAMVRAHASCDAGDPAAQWLAAGLAVRDWALAHPAEYSLAYGTPPPGLRPMPADLAEAHRRVAELPVVIAMHAVERGQLDPHRATMSVPSGTVRSEAVAPGADPDLVAVVTAGCAGLHGVICLELFGHLDGIVEDRDAYFAASCRSVMVGMGFPRDTGDA